MFQRLLVSTDLTDGVYRLTECIANLADLGVSQITFLHVVPLGSDDGIPRVDQDRMKEARQQLTEKLGQVPDTIEVTIDVQCGKAVEVILKALQTYESHVLILGKPINSLFNEKLFGSTTTKLAQRIAIPMMIMRPQMLYTFTLEELAVRCRHLFSRLLLPYDRTDSSQYLLQQLCQSIQRQPTDQTTCITICRVVEPGGYRNLSEEECVKQAEEELAQARSALDGSGVEIEVQLRKGNLVIEVVLASVEADAAAIVISSRNLGKIWEWSVPSFAGDLLRQSWRPVIFFPPERSLT